MELFKLANAGIQASLRSLEDEKRKQAVSAGAAETMARRIALKKKKRHKSVVYEDNKIRIIIEKKGQHDMKKIVMTGDPTKNKLSIDDLMRVMKHPKMEKLFLLDRAWYPLITEDMIAIIQNQFDKCYESDKQAILNCKMKGGNVLSRTEEVLNRIYERAFVVITEVSDSYARCAIIINTDMNLEYNDGLIGMRIFSVNRHQKEDSIVVNDFRASTRRCFRDSLNNKG